MSVSTVQQLYDELDTHDLLDPEQLDELRPQISDFPGVAPFAAQLVDWGWLTPFQIEQILSGHGSGLTLGAYRLLEPIGQGGMGQVFKGVHVRLNRIVAVKTIRPPASATPANYNDLVRRFQREAQAVAQLLHPNIVILFDADEIDGVHYIAMEYVDGIDLSRMVAQQGPLAIQHACEYMRQAANGLQHAHEFGMVHRDIKPSNLLVTRPGVRSRQKGKLGEELPGTERTPLPQRLTTAGVLKILDMGLVRRTEAVEGQDTLSALTMQGTIIGTPDYIAPEQARDASRVDIRADLYSLGCTFYFLLTGRAPFPHGTTVEKIFKHQSEQPQSIESIRPQTPPEVVAIVNRLMAKNPDGRYQTPGDLADAIVALSTGPTQRKPTSGLLQRPDPEDIVVASQPVVGENRTINLRSDEYILPAKVHGTLQGHTGYVTALAFSSTGQFLASGGVDGTVRLWDFGGTRPVERALPQNRDLGEVHTLTFHPAQSTLISGSSSLDGNMWRWDATEQGILTRSHFPGGSLRVGALTYSPDGKQLGAASERSVVVWPVVGMDFKRPTVLKGHNGVVRAVAFLPDGKRVVSVSEDTTIRIWEAGRFWTTQKNVLAGHGDAITAVDCSADGSRIATSSLDRTVRLWDASGAIGQAISVMRGH